MAFLNTQAHLLAAARSGDLATVIAAGKAAGDIMSVTTDDQVYSDAAGVLGTAFDAIAQHLTGGDTLLASLVRARQADLADSVKAQPDASGDVRPAVIAKAVDFLDQTHPGIVTAVLAKTSLHQHLKDDPAALRANLTQADLPVTANYRAARQILDVAGVPY